MTLWKRSQSAQNREVKSTLINLGGWHFNNSPISASRQQADQLQKQAKYPNCGAMANDHASPRRSGEGTRCSVTWDEAGRDQC